MGLATHYVESASLPLLMRRFADLGDRASDMMALKNAISEHESTVLMEPVPPDSIVHKLPVIDKWFAGDTVEAIDEALKQASTRQDLHAPTADFAKMLRAEMRRAAPLSLKVAVEAMRRLKDCTLRECMLTEFRLVVRFMEGEDFYAGVKARLVDKVEPTWKPHSLKMVTQDMVDAFFLPLPKGTEELALGPEPGGRPQAKAVKAAKAAPRSEGEKKDAPRRQRSRL